MSYDNLGRRVVAAGLAPKGYIRGDGRDERGVLWCRGANMENLPALWDAATRGVLLEEIRTVSSNPFVTIAYDIYDEQWRTSWKDGRGEPSGTSEEEALVAAYEEARRRAS